jgi:hypothetical protein
LLLEKGSDGLDGLAILELLGEWVFGQGNAGLPFIVVQGLLEEGFNAR